MFRALDPEPFNAVFAQWAAELSGRLDGMVVAVDGKTVRGSKAGGATPLHLISAYCDDLRLVLGQRASAHKKNEITACCVASDSDIHRTGRGSVCAAQRVRPVR